ncbi:MAG TPA: redoxin domain-containing protein [Chitinophagaceae bacterium]|nr:redoxin domain-containing protein [Chitinophagaceae bacterium]
MKKFLLIGPVCIALLLSAFVTRFNNEYETLKIGSAAPDFNLISVDEKSYNLASFKNAQVLVVIFTCNHCPTAQAYEDRIIKLTSDYANKNVAVVAIMPNDPSCLRLDELDFSDLGDSYAEMKIRAKEKKFNFPYLYDGETETASKAYGPIATPHVFVFDSERKLRYEGRIDDVENPFRSPQSTDARNAIDALLNNREVPVKTTKVFGCSVKWSEKKNLVEKSKAAWAKEPVHLDMIDADSVRNMMKNPSAKLRLINVWSASSEASEQEFPDFVTINRMYRDRDFEFISISLDEPGNRDKALQFLQLQQASNSNYLFNLNDKDKMMKAIDPSWRGVLPYTMLVEPGGKMVYAKDGAIDPAILKSTIVNNHLLGRFP